MRTKDEWLESVKALQEIHAEGEVFDLWKNDHELFVDSIMELAQAAYSGGYEDAVDDITTTARDSIPTLDRSLEYFEEL